MCSMDVYLFLFYQKMATLTKQICFNQFHAKQIRCWSCYNLTWSFMRINICINTTERTLSYRNFSTHTTAASILLFTKCSDLLRTLGNGLFFIVQSVLWLCIPYDEEKQFLFYVFILIWPNECCIIPLCVSLTE